MPAKRPNILLVTGDEWRADALGCAGNPILRTPHVDALAACGVRFANGYTPAPMCVPARVSLLTGQLPRTHGALTNGLTPTDATSFVSLLRSTGYRTAAFGKMHFVPIYRDMGFATMLMAEQHGPGWQIDEYHRWLKDARGMVDWIDLWDQASAYRKTAPEWFAATLGALPSPIPEDAYHTTWITDRFLDFLDGHPEENPFCAWVSYIKPHHPFDPPGRYARMYDPADMPLPPPDDLATKPLVAGFDPRRGHYDISAWTDDDIRRMTALYYGTISHIDTSIGRILAALDRKGVAGDTIVIVTSDHGDFLGHRGFITKTPFIPYEDTIRIPFIVAGPGIAGGRVADGFASLVDLFPTVLELAGESYDGSIDGRSLAPILRGEAHSVTDVVFSENPWGVVAVRVGPWKLIERRDGVAELYNLDDDPGERRNRFPEMASSPVVAGLRATGFRYLLGTQWDRFRRDVDGLQPVLDAEAVALGRTKLAIDPTAWRSLPADTWRVPG